MMCVDVQRGHSGDGCVLAPTLCKDDLFILSWARVGRGSLSSELLMCGGGVRIILSLPFVSVVVTVWWSVGKFVV